MKNMWGKKLDPSVAPPSWSGGAGDLIKAFSSLWLLVKLGHRCVKSNSVSMHVGQVTKYALRCCTNWTREIRWLLVQVHVRYVRVIYLVGYSISLLALTVAVAIMLHIKWVQFSALSSPFTATKAPHTHEQLSRAVNRSRERLIAA